MAALPEVDNFDAEITQIETNEPVIGGPDGVDNRGLKQLGNRTRYLFNRITEILADLSQNFALQIGDYPQLRARATTKDDVGLGNVPNFEATGSTTDGSANKFALASAISTLRGFIDDRLPLLGGQLTGNLTIAREEPTLFLSDDQAGVTGRFRLFEGQLRMQAPQGSLARIEGIGGTDLTGLTVQTGGAPRTVYHTGNLPTTSDPSDGDPGKVATAAAVKAVNDGLPGKADIDGDHVNLRARATTKTDVGLAQVPNYAATSSLTDGAANKFATAAAIASLNTLLQDKLGLGGGTLSGSLTARVDDAILRLQNAAASFQGQLSIFGDVMRVQTTPGGLIRMEGIGQGDIGDVVIRTGGADETVIHTGNLESVVTGVTAASGYIVFPGGLYLQWGTITNPGFEEQRTQLFPIAFPTGAFGVIGQAINADNSSQRVSDFQVTSAGAAASFNYRIQQMDAGGVTVSSVFWMALGN
ncbi:MAG: hypothetical protein AAFR17_09840 [Pseudomonadota bacterium]